MNDFKIWFEEIKADTLWYDSFHFMYHKKNIPKCAQECFVWLLADPVRRGEDIVAHRKALASWCQNAKWDTSAPVQLQQEEVKAEPVEVKPEDMPLRRGSPEYIKRAQEVLDAIKGVGKPIAPMTKEEEEQNGQVRPKAHKFTQTEIEKTAAFNRHQKALAESRRKFFLEAFPDAQEDEITAYLDSFPI